VRCRGCVGERGGRAGFHVWGSERRGDRMARVDGAGGQMRRFRLPGGVPR
jgi:hypothetical protein